MAILHHGTTRIRAERIILFGPDPDFFEPGGGARAENFSACLASGPFYFGTPAEYATHKTKLFPTEGGPVILEFDVPDNVLAFVDKRTFPLSEGLVQFDEGFGLRELRASWPRLSKQIISVGGA